MSVEPETGEGFADHTGYVRPSFPLRTGKIQRPQLPPNTLRRDRLFDWFAARSDRRVTYLVAEAGFGKTTLIADYLRRSRTRTFWYRLDEDDTDGLVFLRYLVAACRSVDPSLLPQSASLLAEAAIEPGRDETVLRALLAEMDCLGEVPSVLVLDDFHMAETVPAIGAMVERLIARSPTQLRLALVGRRTPSLPAAALRARGDLAELGREELRFDESETERLFRESYHQPLEPDVLHALQARTEGWAASLQLVRTAVDGRSPGQVRAFVQSLSGAEGDLYDFLAEEMVGELRPDLRAFVMRLSLLEEIDHASASIAAGVSGPDARRLLAQGERLGLLSKGVGIVATWRLHPLVREFLLARLDAEIGTDGVIGLHRNLASSLESQSWRLAAHHWAAAGNADHVRRVVCAAVPTIIGTGDVAAAADIITHFPDPSPNPWYDIIRSRQLAATGRYREATEASRRAEEAAAGLGHSNRTLGDAQALTKLHLAIQGQDSEMCSIASGELSRCGDPELASIARAARLLFEASDQGPIDELCDALAETAHLNHERLHRRHEAISLLNLSLAEGARGNASAVIDNGEVSLSLLESSGNSGDIAAAHVNLAKGLALAGRWPESQAHANWPFSEPLRWVEPETIAEAAELQAMFGNPAMGRRILLQAEQAHPGWAAGPYWRQVAARVELAHSNPQAANEIISEIGVCPLAPGFSSAIRSLRLQILASRSPADPALAVGLSEGLRFAEHQHAWFWWKAIGTTKALVASNDELATFLRSLELTGSAYLSLQAELATRRLGDMDQAGFEVIRAEATLRPERWHWALRLLLSDQAARPSDIKRAAQLMDLVGDADDIKLLRQFAKRKSLRMPDAGLALTRRLAPPAYVDDLGRLTIRIGERVVPGTEIRKKVLSLLAFLLTRPQFTASREQVIEALWPQMEPEAGANSLNQTSYFLRQIFEPTTPDDATAGYLNSRADLIWLDPELVTSRSSGCLRLLGEIRRDPQPERVSQLAELYTGRFAVDFMYDDWASAFRDTLHASFLDRIERALDLDTKSGAFERALSVAQLALQADPEAEQIELCLLRLYKRTGAYAAASEQYSHYATVMREQLGLEPPTFESI